MHIVEDRALAVHPEYAFIDNDYFEGDYKKSVQPLRHTGFDVYGSHGSCLHLYGSAGGDMHGSILGYMQKV